MGTVVIIFIIRYNEHFINSFATRNYLPTIAIREEEGATILASDCTGTSRESSEAPCGASSTERFVRSQLRLGRLRSDQGSYIFSVFLYNFLCSVHLSILKLLSITQQLNAVNVSVS